MKLQDERELLVLYYADQEGKLSFEIIRKELELKEDPEFDFDQTLSDLIKNNYLQQLQDLSLVITDQGKIRLGDLSTDKYEDINKIPILIRLVLVVIAILAFMMIFPRMFHL